MTATVPPTPILLRQPEEHPTFRGSSFKEPETWLEAYDRVAVFNAWTSEGQLRHVYFALEDAACTWLENQVRSLTTRGISRTRFLATFANVVRKERAEALLETRVQMPNENVALFTEQMARLLRHADPTMPEEKKVCVLMRGVKQKLIAGLMRKPPKTVQEFLSEAATIEKTLEQCTGQYNRRSIQDIAAVLNFSSHDLRELIRSIVREDPINRAVTLLPLRRSWSHLPPLPGPKDGTAWVRH